MNIKQLDRLTACIFGMIILLAAPVPPGYAGVPTTAKANAIMAKVKPKVAGELSARGFTLGQPVFMRIFKMPGELEVWMKKGSRFELFKTYPICSYSGYPGPKLHEGDWQSPEGFYTVSSGQMNPNSEYHLSFNVGYPNTFDRERKRTGSSIMVHGDCSSRGCFAMGDGRMEEIYLLAYSALIRGQEEFGLHIFPFRMNGDNMVKFSSSPWIGFWKNLQEGYTAFEKSRLVPTITADNGRYVVDEQPMKVAMGREGGSPEKAVR